MAVPLEDRRPPEEPGRTSWNTILEYALRLLPLLAAALPATIIVAHSYGEGYAAYFHIPSEFIRVGPQQAIAPFSWAFFIVALLLRFAHQAQMFGAWPALRKNLIQLRGIFFVLLVVVAIVELHNRQLSLFAVCVVVLFWVYATKRGERPRSRAVR